MLRLLKNCAIPVLLGTCLIVGVVAVAVVALAPAGLNPVEALVLRVYLSRHSSELNSPYGSDPTVQRFVVEENDDARMIGIKLVTQGYIANGTLFQRYAQFHGLDTDLRAGTFFISSTMTIPEIAAELTDPTPQVLRLLVVEGWRMEQIAEAIDAQPLLGFSGNDFLALVGAGAPLPPEFQQRHGIPSGSSLEGFLFPATYEVRLDATAAELRDQMLNAFDANVSATMINDATAQGFSMYEVVTLASIVEREAVLVDERPQIASVYLNRLSIGQKLDADPTTQYAIGNTRDGNWWPQLTVDDYQLANPYNTYVNIGLPPGPIANPGLSSIRAVIYPAVSPYFYFRADCDGSGGHQFSVTYEEHLSKACP